MIAQALVKGALALTALAPQTVLTRYEIALQTLKEPPAYSVDYSFEHRGQRPQDRHDRIYRQGASERVEIISVNGEKLTRPQVQIYRDRPDRYAIARLAPAPAAYAFTYVGPLRAGRKFDYVFDTTPSAPGPFAITQVTIDGASFLPKSVKFATTATAVAVVEGKGEVVYAKVNRFWVPVSASARAKVGTAVESERISWSAYRFFSSLPSSTFAQPKPAATLPPAA
ncbi:MAG: hypothetical protein JO101_01550 [Candidatus Eremiobacteraeota bacterium]|nr:hypothetical protein [Candidatus Eremiobacteraeota bacterium]MBV8353977.1 hypothetical protein [Candidatus Eremiobacteraeota bacterium]